MYRNTISKSFKNVTEFKYKYFGLTVINQSCTHGEVISRINSGNDCLLSCLLLAENTKVKIHRIIIIFVVLCGCASLSVTFREGHRLRVSENWVLRQGGREVFGSKR